MKYLLVLSFSLLLLLSAQKGVAQCYSQVWADEFDNTGAPSATNWTHEVNGNGGGNNELQYYTDRLVNSECSNGTLKITALKESYQGKSYTSARLITYGKKSFKYGKIEARIKMPYGQGIWPAFWMLGNSIFTGTSWPSCGEIDVVEMIGGGVNGINDKTVYGTPHWGDASGNHAQYGGNTVYSDKLSNAFHTYSIEWTSTYIKWFFDGVQYHVMSTTPADLSEFQNDYFILLNLAVGGQWPGNPDATTVFPQTMEVDYVRVYQQTLPEAKVTGSSVVSQGEEVTFSVDNPLADITYNWGVPAGCVIKSGNGTSSIVVTWGNESGNVTCSAVNTCQSSTALTPLSVAVAQKPTGDVFNIPLVKSGAPAWVVSSTYNGTFGVTANSQDNLNLAFNFTGGQTNSFLIHTFEQLYDFTNLSEIQVTMKVLTGAAPRNISVDLISLGGGVDAADAFTLTQISRKHNFVTYKYKCNNQSTLRPMNRIEKMVIYVNRGVSNLVTSGTFEIGAIQMVNSNLVSDVTTPTGEAYAISHTDSNSNLLWQGVGTDGNTITTTLNGSNSNVSWSIVSQSGTKKLVYTFEKPIDVTSYNQLELKLSTLEPSQNPANLAITLIDVNGVANANNVWTITNYDQINESGYLHFATGNSIDGGEWLPQQIKKIEIVLNNDLPNTGSGLFVIESARLVPEPVNTSISDDANVESTVLCYPNPVTTVFNIDLSQTSGNSTIAIVDLSGVVVAQLKAIGGELNQMNVSHLPKGAYLVMVNGDTAVYTFTLIKK